jgi:hypothetical protein
MLHSHLTRHNLLFDSDGKIQIADFCVHYSAEQEGNSRARADVGCFSVEDWISKADVLTFIEIVSESTGRDSTAQSDVPMFVPEIIEGGESAHSGTTKSFFRGARFCERD